MLGPEWDIFHELGGCGLVIRTDHLVLKRLADIARRHGFVVFVDPETFSYGRVRQVITIHIFQAGVQIAGADAIRTIHPS